MSIKIYTSDEEITKALSNVFNPRFDCKSAEWAWGAYELMRMINEVNKCPESSMLDYLWINYKLRIERNLKMIMELKNKLQSIRKYLRNKCEDILTCLANRIYKYDDAVKEILNYYKIINELTTEDLAKLSLAAYRYGLMNISIEIFKRLIMKNHGYTAYLTLISMMSPQWWPSHLTIDTGILKLLNWLLMLFNNHYLILMINFYHNYVVSDLNVNIDGSRLINDNYYDIIEHGNEYVLYHVISRSGHGVLFIGNWSNSTVDVPFNHTFSEGSVKSMFIDVNIRQWIPHIVLPHDYLSIKY